MSHGDFSHFVVDFYQPDTHFYGTTAIFLFGGGFLWFFSENKSLIVNGLWFVVG